MTDSLWGDAFTPVATNKKAVVRKAKKPKEELSTDKALRSKTVSIEEKMRLIETEVYRILGHFKGDTKVIRNYDDLKAYIDKAIEIGYISIDTETNNSLNTFDCLIMGLCLYVPGEKQAYVPVNHCNFKIENDELVLLDRLPDQLTEEQIKTQLDRLTGVRQIYHNATFDIEVVLQTCKTRLKAYWDTLIGAQLINENELKSLKAQYRLHIDPDQEKYDIEHLFNGLPYAIFRPELFALYAATDPRITYELYVHQKAILEQEDQKDVYNLFKTIEVPLIDVIVDMELAGVSIDLDYAEKMDSVYTKRLDDVKAEIADELKRLDPVISTWKLSPEANAQKMVYPPKKTSLTPAKLALTYPLIDSKGQRYKIASKTPAQQLSDPIDLASPTQLGILLYDIMKVPVVDKSAPRGTGADILKTLAEEKHVKICELLLKFREVDILINSFIRKIPTIVDSDGKARTRFNQCGTATGRFSSSGNYNVQQIPSHAKDIRMMFIPSCNFAQVDIEDTLELKKFEEVEVDGLGWMSAISLKVGMTIKAYPVDAKIVSIDSEAETIVLHVL